MVSLFFSKIIERDICVSDCCDLFELKCSILVIFKKPDFDDEDLPRIEKIRLFLYSDKCLKFLSVRSSHNR